MATKEAEEPGFESIIIVGAGCSGLLLALLLTTLDPRPHITILDADTSLNTTPRATHYGPPAISVLRKAGILQTVRDRGFMPKTLCWRKLDGTRIAGFDRSLLHDDGYDGDGTTVLPVGELAKLVVEALEEKGVRPLWGRKVIAVGGQEDGAEKAWVDVEVVGEQKEGSDATATERYEADFVIGCDGGNSGVRRCLFGREGFPGYTWTEQIVATNTLIDLDKFGWEDTQFIIHPEHWYMATRIKGGFWRITYGEVPGLSDEDLIARQPGKFETFLPGHPKKDEYEIVSISPYKVHQRCVEKMAVGRVALAADAAHLCNPFGGMGLTGGIVDVEGLYECLAGIHANIADLSILDTYSDIRIQRWKDIINPVSTGNLSRLCKQDPEKALENDEFLQMVKRCETDEELSRQVQTSTRKLKYDFTQHYNDKKGEKVRESENRSSTNTVEDLSNGRAAVTAEAAQSS